ncbi:ASCH domain-containing protein [Tritonibacter scottomollicae]|uniref:ASCH domain-containing protein n=1 Tax=Tritonibacter scottomollicae TaxID=483013 RepID=UPI003AA9A8FA
MKALSIVAPGGARIASGEKTLEVRRWAPDLHPNENLLIIENSRFLHNDGEEVEDGKAVAFVRVATVRPFQSADIAAACASYYENGWLAWELTNIRPISYSQPVLAARGIYEVSVDLPLL